MYIIQQARAELDACNFSSEDSAVMIEILEKFFSQWNSGSTVPTAAMILHRLIMDKPLTPLTGSDDEWFALDHSDEVYAQNRRCSTVFKNRDGSAYDIASGSRKQVTFPYWPPSFEESK